MLDSAPLTGASNTLTQVEAVDVDGDGRTELAVLDGGGIGVFGRREVGWRMAAFAFPNAGNYNPVQMVITDFTGDGCPGRRHRRVDERDAGAARRLPALVAPRRRRGVRLLFFR